MKSALLIGAVLAAVGPATSAAAAPVLKVLYSFQGPPDGYNSLLNSNKGLIFDRAGNLYGTTIEGGFGTAYQDGLVFELSPPAAGGGAWTETVIHYFTGGPDGAQPYAGLIADSAGHLYGTTHEGGKFDGGTAFELTPPAAGQTAWTETVLYAFGGFAGKLGEYPFGGLMADGAGNFYGTTYYGGATPTGGTVFKLTPPAAGKTAWSETRLYSFKGGATSSLPRGALMAGSAGNLFGTTFGGSANAPTDYGSVFRLRRPAAGKLGWTETTLHAFTGGGDSEYPYNSLIADKDGNLYGTTAGNAILNAGTGFGTVFKLTPPVAGQTSWGETVLHTFQSSNDGAVPLSNLIADRSGKLYGTTLLGGGSGACTIGDNQQIGCGTVYVLTPPAAGKTAWTETVLYAFNGQVGADPFAGLIADSAGNLYGMTEGGGAFNRGTVFELTGTGFTP